MWKWVEELAVSCVTCPSVPGWNPSFGKSFCKERPFMGSSQHCSVQECSKEQLFQEMHLQLKPFGVAYTLSLQWNNMAANAIVWSVGNCHKSRTTSRVSKIWRDFRGESKLPSHIRGHHITQPSWSSSLSSLQTLSCITDFSSHRDRHIKLIFNDDIDIMVLRLM